MLDITEKHISKVGVDVGGTFTDLFSYDAKGRTTLRAKVLSTPDNYTTGVIRAISDSGVDVKKIDYLIGCRNPRPMGVVMWNWLCRSRMGLAESPLIAIP